MRYAQRPRCHAKQNCVASDTDYAEPLSSGSRVTTPPRLQLSIIDPESPPG